MNVGGTPAPLIYASSTQINAVVPYEISRLLALPVSVTYQEQGSNGFTVGAAPATVFWALLPGAFSVVGAAGIMATKDVEHAQMLHKAFT